MAVVAKWFCIGALGIMGLFLAFMLLYLFVSLFDWEDNIMYLLGWRIHTNAFKDNHPCLTFEQFVSFYNVAPENWDIDLEEQVGYRKGITLIWLGFSTYGDCFKYSRWRKKEKERLRTIEMSKTMNKLLDMVREDSAEYERKAYERANAVYDEILKTLNREK